MGIKNRLSLCLALVLLCAPLRAQWYGSLDFSGGYGAIGGNDVTDEGKPMVHALAQGEFLIGKKMGNVIWESTLKGKWEPKTTDNARLSLKKENVTAVQKAATTKPLTLSLKQDFKWTLTPARQYNAWILYGYVNDQAYNHSLNISGTDETNGKLAYYYEVPSRNDHRVETGFKSSREFDGGRKILGGAFKVQAVNSRRYNTWTAFKTKEEGNAASRVDLGDGINGYVWKYRITPNSTDVYFDGDIHLKMKLVDSDLSLSVTPGARLSTQYSLDRNSGATRINFTTDEAEEQWKDSTSLRETFHFLSVKAESFLVADFRWNKVDAHIDMATQVYGRRLNNETTAQPFKIKGVYPVGKANIRWTISPRHSLNFKNEMTVAHPDFLKVCWYDRTSGYIDQLYRGNENLRSPHTILLGLEYGLKAGRFVAKTGVAYKQALDEIDKTWAFEEIDGRQYKVFRWINSADCRSLGLSQSIGWRGKAITANVEVNYNLSRRIGLSAGAVKDSRDWQVKGDVMALLGKGWSLDINGRYRSKQATFYSSTKAQGELNASIIKDFKNVTLYLEGRDLLDQPTETKFESEELQEYWIEVVRRNRSMVILGVKWKF